MRPGSCCWKKRGWSSDSLSVLRVLPDDQPRFFQQRDPGRIFDHPIESAFPDGMRCCEYLLRDFANTARYCRRSSVIALHDCVPVEIAIADQKAAPSVEVSRAGWWVGDVWRTLLAL